MLRTVALVGATWLMLFVLEALAGINPWARRVRRRYADQPFVRKFALDEEATAGGQSNVLALLIFDLANAIILALFFELLVPKLPEFFLTQGALFGALMWLPRVVMRAGYVYMSFDVGGEWIAEDLFAQLIVMIILGIGMSFVSQLV